MKSSSRNRYFQKFTSAVLSKHQTKSSKKPGNHIEDVKIWLSANKLNLNADKIDIFYFCFKRRSGKTLKCLRGYITRYAALMAKNALAGS